MKQQLADSLKKWWNAPLPITLPRDVSLSTFFDPNVKKILVVTGFRRVGKTYTLLDFAAKYGKENTVYINFENETLTKTKVLTQLTELLTELRGDTPLVLLMDEIQEIPNWSLWARRINETTNHRLIISGSSSKLSSQEIPTELRGQTITLPLSPLNWQEFLRFKRVDSNNLPHDQKLNLLREFLTFGGLPEIVLAQEGSKPLILADYFRTFVDRDVVERHKIRDRDTLTDLLRLLPNTQSYTYSKMANSLKSMGHEVSKTTVIRYLRWLEASYFQTNLEVLAGNVKTKAQTARKSYLIDNYFTYQYSSNLSANFGFLMEQAVFHKLRGLALWDPRFENAYWKDYHNSEVDFVVIKNKNLDSLIQVTFARTPEEIAEREIKSLLKAAKFLGHPSGTIITWDAQKSFVEGGIKIDLVPLWKWLN